VPIRRLDCLFDDRDLALVELEVDDFRRTWVIEGPGKERARIGYAVLKGDEVRYSFPEKTAEVPAVLTRPACVTGARLGPFRTRLRHDLTKKK